MLDQIAVFRLEITAATPYFEGQWPVPRPPPRLTLATAALWMVSVGVLYFLWPRPLPELFAQPGGGRAEFLRFWSGKWRSIELLATPEPVA